MSLSKKTKNQLMEIASDLDVDISTCRVKKDILETIKAHLLLNAPEIDENSKYFETIEVLKLADSLKRAAEKVEEEVDEEDSEETSETSKEGEAEDSEEDDSDEGEEGEQVEEEDGEGEDEEEDGDEEDEESQESEDFSELDSDDDEYDFVYATTLSEAIQNGNIVEYIEYKSLELRDYLSDPFSINEIAFRLQTIYLISQIYKSTKLNHYLSPKVSQYIPSLVQNFNVPDTEMITLKNSYAVGIWLLSAYVLPNLGSYYINFTYEFQYDAFTYALTKLFIAVIVFKETIPADILILEAKYNWYSLFSGATFTQTLVHGIFIGFAALREIFGNWVIFETIFASVLAFYANLSFV